MENVIRLVIDGGGISESAQPSSGLKTGATAGVAAGAVTGKFSGISASPETVHDFLKNPSKRQSTRDGQQFARSLGYDMAKDKGMRGTGALQIAKNISAPTLKQTNVAITAVSGTSTLVLNHMADSASLRGANHKADALQNLSTGIGTVAGISTAFLIGGPVGGAVAMAGMAYKGYLENRKLIREFTVESIELEGFRRRLISSTSEGR